MTCNPFHFAPTLGILLACTVVATMPGRAAPTPEGRPLSPDTILIGQGGVDGFLAVDGKGGIHVVFGGRYRFGSAPAQLGPEEPVTDLAPVNTVRMSIDAAGRPHVVFTVGMGANSKRSYYTARIDGRWLPAETFAEASDFPERTRAYVADVAVDERAHVLASFWVARPRERWPERENPSFYYRWRTPDGKWSEPRSLPAHWSSTPKVEYVRGRGFHLLWQSTGRDWRIAGPVPAGAEFKEGGSSAAGSATLTGLTGVLNEGADFSTHGDVMVVAGNVREKFDGPVGVWASVIRPGEPAAATFIGGFPDTKRGDESGLHPVTTLDAATGVAFLTVMNPADKRAYFATWRQEGGWTRSYVPVLPDQSAPQGTLRQGPSVADLPGPGVVALIRDREARWYLRTLPAPEAP